MDSTNSVRIPLTVIADNRVTIPRNIVEEWGIRRGDKIWVTIEKPKVQEVTSK